MFQVLCFTENASQLLNAIQRLGFFAVFCVASFLGDYSLAFLLSVF
jgi:hypothetical protein